MAKGEDENTIEFLRKHRAEQAREIAELRKQVDAHAAHLKRIDERVAMFGAVHDPR